MATLNNSFIYNETLDTILSSNIVPQPLPIKTSGQAWPKGK